MSCNSSYTSKPQHIEIDVIETKYWFKQDLTSRLYSHDFYFILIPHEAARKPVTAFKCKVSIHLSLHVHKTVLSELLNCSKFVFIYTEW